MRRHLAVAVVALFVLAGCGDDTSSQGDEGSDKIVRVVTTTTQLTDFATVIGGEHVEVTGLLTANVDPHDFEPSPADLNALADADLIVKNGVGLEKWFDDTIANAESDATVVDASTGVDVREAGEDHADAEGEHAEAETEDDDHGHEEGDPHIWLDPDNAVAMVGNITDALVEIDPTHEPDYRANEEAYGDELTSLDTEIKADVAALTNKKLVTNHDAFGYFIEHYGFEFVGAIIPSFDTQAELSPSDINDIVGKIKATGVKAVFSESSLPPKTAETIGNEAGVRVVAGEDALYADTLGPDGSEGDTYLKMMRHNAKVIIDNLR